LFYVFARLDVLENLSSRLVVLVQLLLQVVDNGLGLGDSMLVFLDFQVVFLDVGLTRLQGCFVSSQLTLKLRQLLSHFVDVFLLLLVVLATYFEDLLFDLLLSLLQLYNLGSYFFELSGVLGDLFLHLLHLVFLFLSRLVVSFVLLRSMGQLVYQNSNRVHVDFCFVSV